MSGLYSLTQLNVSNFAKTNKEHFQLADPSHKYQRDIQIKQIKLSIGSTGSAVEFKTHSNLNVSPSVCVCSAITDVFPILRCVLWAQVSSIFLQSSAHRKRLINSFPMENERACFTKVLFQTPFPFHFFSPCRLFPLCWWCRGFFGSF